MKRTGLLILCLLMFGCAHGGGPALKWAFDDELQEAKKMIQSGNRRQAVDELSMLLEMNPKNHEARLLRAMAYQNLDEFDLAIQDYEAILKADPKAAKAHYNLGMIYAFQRSDPARALAHFDQFLSCEPDHPRGVEVAKIMTAIDRRGDREGPTHPELMQQATAAVEPGKKREILREWAGLDPLSPVPLYLIGKTFEYEGREEDAIRSYQEALQCRPTCAPCHLALGKLLVQRRAASQGRLHLKKAALFEAGETETFSAETPSAD